MIEEWWDWFVDGFCRVEFVCYQGEPNWLGWIVIGLPTLFISFLVIVGALALILDLAWPNR
jgi:hypothetical protein